MVISGFSHIKEIPHITVGYIGKAVKLCEVVLYILGLWLQSFIVGITMWALSICIFIIAYGRMIEIYLVTSVAPIPMSTMVNREWGQMGQNYLRSLGGVLLVLYAPP